MSDKRATYVIGAVAAALALVLGLITAVPVSSSITSMDSPLDFAGHAIVVLKDSDGNIKAYRQSDNLVVFNGQDCAADLIFGVIEAGLCAGSATIFSDIRIGSDTNNAPTSGETTLVADLGFAGTGELIAEADAVTGTGALKTIEGTFVLTGATTVGEVGLFDTPAGTEMFSRISLTTPITAGLDDTVTITYIIKVGAG